ncbi:transketolase [Amycolatopsis sp. NPDC051903]|uniref:transketolase n=1 Tax=Amycolatopsis sp. NPDC051903 TaxID=3363936 RepID=UPI0037A96271
MSDTASTEQSPAGAARRTPEGWTATDTRAVDTVRVLAADAVEQAGSGHPGTAMSLAPLAYTLFQRELRHDPADPEWIARDRFVLSAGHTSLTLYIQLFLAGYGLELDDLKALRTWGSLTPGHPEYRHTKGVEVTTGPLGQGLANAVGMAMASRRERGLFDPEPEPGQSIFDHWVYVIASDGDIEEGITSEASSIAGRQQLGNLIVFYDDNDISIEDHTDIALSEDTDERYRAYGWHVQVVEDGEDVAALQDAVAAAKADPRPSYVRVRTVIGFPAPNKQNTGKIHGSALGADEVAATKRVLGFDPEQHFVVDDDVLTLTRKAVARGAQWHAEWQVAFDEWAAANPGRAALLKRLSARELPEGWAEDLPTFEPGGAEIATRKGSGAFLNAVADKLPELWGGSADLAESNNSTMDGADSFGPQAASTKMWTAEPFGRTLHFGIREHAMGGILNGITLHGGTRPYGATYLAFSDYMRPSVRLAALMQLPVVYVWTHDSIGVGGDGPTHQPIEHLSALRAIPGLNVVRPGDANEAVGAWRAAIEDVHHPSALAFTRQPVPVLAGTSADAVARGGYVLADASNGDPQLVLIGTGSELQLAVAARERLEAEGVPTRVVSLPCFEWFAEQDQAYRDSVIPPSVKARVAVEAGIAMPWYEFVGDAGEIVSIEHYGASADYATLFREFGFTPEAVVAAARKTLATVAGNQA